jgi:hypothetical protein
MYRVLLSISLLAAMFGIALFATPAQAQATRTWVSGVGDDANPCSRTAPCKTFAGAISKTAAGGEINCIDPGGFGGVTITKALTIDCASTEAGVLVAGTNGITVNAGVNDVVVLRGLDIIGTAATPGLNGIRFLAGKALHVEKCTITEFLAPSPNGFGISFQPSGLSQLFVSNSSITNNGTGTTGGGILIKASGGSGTHATLSNVIMQGNVTGLTADGTAATATTYVSMINSVAAGSSVAGISVVTPAAGGGSTSVMVDQTSVVNNTTGISSDGAKSAALITNSTIIGNNTGLSATGGGLTITYKTNNINLGNVIDGTPTTQTTQN